MLLRRKRHSARDEFIYYGGFTFNKRNRTIVDYRNNLTKNTDVIIPEVIEGLPVEGIGDYAFRKKGIRTLNISKSIKSFGKGCFVGNDIQELIVPEGMTVPEEAFLVC